MPATAAQMTSSGRESTRCGFCGSGLPPDARYCPACGRPIHPSAARPESTPRLLDVPIWTAAKAGFGFAAGVWLFGAFILAVVLVAFAALALSLR
jgi:hypothetical protein